MDIHYQIKDYLGKRGFNILLIDYDRIGSKRSGRVYTAIRKEGDGHLFLEWYYWENHPTISVLRGVEGSTEETRVFLGEIKVRYFGGFKDAFTKFYINEYGFVKWVIRGIQRVFRSK